MEKDVKDVRYKFLKIKEGSSTGFNSESIDIKSYRSRKPMLLCLGGNMTSGPLEANSIAKQAQRSIGAHFQTSWEQGTPDDVDIISIAYGLVEPKNGEKEGATKLLRDEISEIVDNLFIPRLLDDDGNILICEDAMKNFNAINFFTHCYGANVVNMFISDLSLKMENLGYTEEEISMIIKQMSQVTYAPLCKPYLIPTVEVKTCKDNVVREWESEWGDDPLKTFNGIVLRNPESDRLTVWTSQLANGDVEINGEHGVGLVNRNNDWELESKDLGHTIGYAGKNADAVSQIMSYILARFVANSMQNRQNFLFSPKPLIKDLEGEIESILSGFGNEDLMSK